MTFGLHFLPWRRFILILGIVSLLLPIYFWRVSTEPKHETSRQGSHYIDLFKRKTVWIMGLLWIFAAGSCLGIYSVLPLYLIKERGIDLYLANNLFGISRMGGGYLSPSSSVF
jgi:NNP family nitrate/nitrite transporter-like MFS transporter